MKMTPHYIRYWNERYQAALLDAIGAAALLGLEQEKKQLYNMSCQAMGLKTNEKSALYLNTKDGRKGLVIDIMVDDEIMILLKFYDNREPKTKWYTSDELRQCDHAD